MEDTYYWMAPTKQPTTSLLFGLEPKGLGTGQVQSAYDYICWLAHAHRITPTIVSNLALQSIGKAGRQLSLRQHFGRDCHGVTQLAQHVVDGLTKVCGRGDISLMTMQPLRDFIAGHSLLARDRRCCTTCLASTSAGVIPHGRLLWRLKDVEVCPTHRIQLVTTECGTPLSRQLTHDQRVVLEGVCPKCGSIGRRCTTAVVVKATKAQVWKAKQLAELLSRQVEVQTSGVTAFKKKMQEHYAHDPGGIHGLCSRLNAPSAAICRFLREPTARISLNTLLQIAAVEGFNLTDFMLGRMIKQHRPQAAPDAPHRNKYFCPDDWRSTENKARRAASRGMSLLDFTRKENLHETTFRRHLPQQARALADNTLSRNEADRNARQKERLKEVEQTATTALKRGLPLTLRVASELTETVWYPSSPKAQMLLAVSCALNGKAYPEKHPWSQSLRDDLQRLVQRLARYQGVRSKSARSD